MNFLAEKAENDQNLKSKNRVFYIEILRILACLLVVYNHSRGYSCFYRFSSQFGDEPLPYWGFMVVSGFASCNVPIFFAISGALLLSKEETILTIWKKRISKMVVTLIVFSFVYYIWNIHRTGGAFSLGEFFLEVYSSVNINGTFWYLYSYIGFLICLPFIRPMVRSMKNSSFIYMFALATVFSGVLPTISRFIFDSSYSCYLSNSMTWLTTNMMYWWVYASFGYYVEHRADINKLGKYLPYMWGINIVTIVIQCIISHQNMIQTENFSAVFWYFAFVNCATVFITVKFVVSKIDKIPLKVEKVIKSVGSCTYGIYLFHILLLSEFTFVFDFLNEKCHVPYMITAWIHCILVMLVGYIITLLLKKIFRNRLV